MLRLRLTTDAQPRWKKGQPPQRTTGVARTNLIQASFRRKSVAERLRPQHGGHGQDDQRRGQRQADPKSPRHEAEFGVDGLFPRNGKGFQRHAALGARARAAVADLRIHGASVYGSGILPAS